MTRVVPSFWTPFKAFAMILACVLTGCWRPASPAGTLTERERGFYGAVRSFEDLFEEVDRIDISADERATLSVRPLIKAVTGRGELVILDKLNVRKIFVFGPGGDYRRDIGAEGRGAGEFIYPHTLSRDPSSGEIYVYDGDLLRVGRYDETSEFLGLFQLPLLLHSLLFTDSGRFFVYSSMMAQEGKIGDTVYELDREGVVLNSFARQSESFSRWGATEGGGIASSGAFLYVVTPYEYLIRVFSENGHEVLTAVQESPFYRPPGPPPEPNPEVENFVQLRDYHQSWAHVRQVLSIGDRFIGVTFAPAGRDSLIFDLFDRDLQPVVEDLEFPEVIGDLFTQGDELYMIPPDRITVDGRLANPQVVRLRLRTPES